MRYLRYVFLPILLVSVLFVGVLFVGGCQQKDEWKPTDLNFVAMSVNNLGDALNNEEQLKLLYVDGALPDDDTLDELRGYMAKARGENVSVDGDTATVDVMFEISRTGEHLGPQQWTLVRVGEAWKLKDTPPP